MHMLCVCVSVCLSRSWVVSKRINISKFFSLSGSHTILVFPCQTAWQYSDGDRPNGGVECRWGRQKSWLWAYTSLCLPLALQHARCCQHGRRRTPDGHHLASYDTSPVVSGGVDCGRRWRNVYDKKPQRYAKDNRTAHLTACTQW